MGYYTNYTLEASPNSIIKKVKAKDVIDPTILGVDPEQELIRLISIEEALKEVEKANPNLFDGWLSALANGGMSAEGKWYEHDFYMREVSKILPEILFTLTGVGEENGDFWVSWYKGGKGYRWEPEKPQVPAFDSSKLT